MSWMAEILGIEKEYSIQEGHRGSVTILEGKDIKEVLVKMKPSICIIREGNIIHK